MPIARLVMRCLAACILAVVSLGSLDAVAAAADGAPCPPSDAQVTGVRRVLATNATAPIAEVEMGEVILVSGKDLGGLSCAAGKPVVLFLDGLALKDVVGVPADNGSGFRFKLERGPASKKSWDVILGRPDFDTRPLDISIGFADSLPIPSTATIAFVALPQIPFTVGLIEFLALCWLFYKLAVDSTLLRSATPDQTAPDQKGPYSLSKTQAALWFFVVLGAYLFIGCVTGDYTTSINGTALILLALGGGTAAVSAGIGQSQDTSPQVKADEHTTKDQLAAAHTHLVAAGATPNPDGTSVNDQKLAQVVRAQHVISNVSLGFLHDIMSDADGVCFHRFQNVAWNVVFTGVFIRGVYDNLAMPDFDMTTFGLLGVSSATYLALKNSEAVVPSVPPTAGTGATGGTGSTGATGDTGR